MVFGAAMRQVQFLCMYSAWRSRGSGGMKFRPYESASETVRDHTKIYGSWTVTQVIHRMVVSRSPSLSELAFVYEALPQNCLQL